MNILVTGVGAIIGYGIINSLRQSGVKARIIGMDIYEENYGKNIVDKFYQAKRADSKEYISFIQNLVSKESIDLIIPGIEQDMYKLHEEHNKINTKIVLNNDLLITISKDKWETYQYFLENTDLQLIPTLSKDTTFEQCRDKLGVPFIMKPRSSYASKGIHLIDNREDFDFYNKKNNYNNIFQKIVGNIESEYTISLFGDGQGGFKDYIVLRRKLAQTGATDKAEVIKADDDIIKYITKICSYTKPVGPTNIQLRKEENSVYLLEINPRISSACSIRTMANYNEPLMCVKYFLLNEPILSRPKEQLKVVRFIQDYRYE